MSDKPAATSSSMEVLESVRLAATKVANGADGEFLLADVHGLWRLACGSAFGGTRSSLVNLAQAFANAATQLSSTLPAASDIAALGGALASLRNLEFAQAASACGGVAQKPGALQPIAVCWQAIAHALAGKSRVARQFLDASGGASADQAALTGLCRYALAIIAYKQGRYDEALRALDEAKLSFHSRNLPELVDYPCFEADRLLLRAKTQRELGRYAQALESLADAQLLRQVTDDTVGKAWGLLEQARCHRFRGEYKEATLALREASLLIEPTDFIELKARLEDQLGDVHRAQKEYGKAEQNYRRAMDFAQASSGRTLHAHLANSMARLLEQRGRGREALEILKKHERVWRDTKSYGKYLYLTGSIHTGLGNRAEAEDLLRAAIVHQHKHHNRVFEAMAHARLAELYTELRKPGKASASWVAALQLAPAVEAQGFCERLEARANQLRPADFLQGIAALAHEKSRLADELQRERAAQNDAQERSQTERYLVGHRLSNPLLRFLDKPPSSFPKLPRYLRDFAALFYEPGWYTQDFARHPAEPMEDIDLASLAGLCADSLSKEFGATLQIDVAKTAQKLRANRYWLTRAVESLLRGAHTAYGTRTCRLAVRQCWDKRWPVALEVELVDPPPKEFGRAPLLVRLDSIWDEPTLLAFFERGYTGGFTLMDFIVRVALWGKIEFVESPASVLLQLPADLRKEVKHVRPSQAGRSVH